MRDLVYLRTYDLERENQYWIDQRLVEYLNYGQGRECVQLADVKHLYTDLEWYKYTEQSYLDPEKENLNHFWVKDPVVIYDEDLRYDIVIWKYIFYIGFFVDNKGIIKQIDVKHETIKLDPKLDEE